MKDRSYTAAQIEAATGIDQKTVFQRMADGDLKAFVPRGMKQRKSVAYDDLIDWFGGPLPLDIDGFDLKGRPVAGPAQDSAQVA